MKSYNSDETDEDFLSFPKFKTIIVKAISNNDAKESYLSLCIPKNSRICNNKLSDFLSENELGFFVKPKGIMLAPKDVAENITGFKSGSIPPFGFSTPLISIVDTEALASDFIITGSGKANHYLKTSVSELLQKDYRVGDISNKIEITWRNESELIYPVKTDALASKSIKQKSPLKVYGYPPKFSEPSQNLHPPESTHDTARNDYNFNKSEYDVGYRITTSINENENINKPTIQMLPSLQIPSVDITNGRVHLVGIITKKRAVSKNLVFLSIIPPELAVGFQEYELVEGYKDNKVWRSTISNDTNTTVTMEVQIILGATILNVLGEETGRIVLKNVKVGQKVYIVGKSQKNPKSEEILDIVCHSIRVLEEKEISIPLQVTENLRYQQSSLKSNTVHKSNPANQSYPLSDSNTIIQSNTNANNTKYFKLDIHPNNLVFVDNKQSLQIMADILDTEIFSIPDKLIDGLPVYSTVSIDCEWRPENYFNRNSNYTNTFKDFNRGIEDQIKSTDNKSPVAVLQIATRNFVFVIDLFHIFRRLEDNIRFSSLYTTLSENEKAFNDIFEKIFSSVKVLKIGIGINQDLKRLFWSYPWIPCFRKFSNILDLQTLAKIVHSKVPKRDLDGVSKLAFKQFGLPVDKTMQCSDWGSRPLAPSQIEYAAIDVLVLVRIFDSLFTHSELAVLDSVKTISALTKSYAVSVPERAAHSISSSKETNRSHVNSSIGIGQTKDIHQMDFSQISLKSLKMIEL